MALCSSDILFVATSQICFLEKLHRDSSRLFSPQQSTETIFESHFPRMWKIINCMLNIRGLQTMKINLSTCCPGTLASRIKKENEGGEKEVLNWEEKGKEIFFGGGDIFKERQPQERPDMEAQKNGRGKKVNKWHQTLTRSRLEHQYSEACFKILFYDSPRNYSIDDFSIKKFF